MHFKLGRENAVVWVTSLDKGKPMPGAKVRVSDCNGRELAQAITNEQGVATIEGLSPVPPSCNTNEDYAQGSSAYFVSARHTEGGVEDMAFTWSDWQRALSPGASMCPPAARPSPTSAPTPCSTAPCSVRVRRCR